MSFQALRGAAALAVVLFHLLPFEAKFLPGPSIVPAGFSAGRAGVDLFFVLSGFLALWSTLGPGGGGAARHFLLRRVTRIYPTYWFYCIPLILIGIAAPSGLPGSGNPDLFASLLLIPTAASPLLLVAWTLEFEVYFYLIFTISIWARLARRQHLLALFAWGLAVAVTRALLQPVRSDAFIDAILSPLVFEFLSGCAAAYVCASEIRPAKTGVACLAACGILVIGFIWSETFFALPWLRVVVFGVGFALLLTGCLGEDAVICRWLPSVTLRIGDASYSLYLSHLFTLQIAGRLLRHFTKPAGLLATPTGHTMALCASVAAALLVAQASYRWIECPLLHLTQRLIKPPALRQPIVAR